MTADPRPPAAPPQAPLVEGRPHVRPRVLIAVAAASGLLIGLTGARWFGAVAQDGAAGAAVPLTAQAETGLFPPPPTDPSGLVSITSATSPRGAVESFLTAETLGAYAASYRFLSAADRVTYPTPAAWREARASLPATVSYRVVEVGDPVVVAVVALASADETVPDPALHRMTFTTVEEEGGYRVDYGGIVTAPPYQPG